MIGQPYNPDNCVLITNQTLNANQGNENVPNASNSVPHIFLWDFVENKMYWVNSLTNIITQEFSAGGGTVYESGFFYLNPSEVPFGFDGSPNVSIINPGPNPTIRIATTKRMKLGFFSAMKGDGLDKGKLFSEGRTDGVYSTIIIKLSLNDASFISMEDQQDSIINVYNTALIGQPGWSGSLPPANVTDTYIDIEMTQSGAGNWLYVRFQLEEA